MPFDFLELKHYEVDYKELFEELNSQNLFSDRNAQNMYFMRWMEELKNCDKVIRNELNSKEDILRLSMFLRNEPEIFQLPMNHINNRIYIHFRVSIANDIIKSHGDVSQYVELNEFRSSKSEIRWNPVDRHLTSQKRTDPILIVPYKNNQYNYLVIDGNHRITYKVNNMIDDIRATFLAEESVIDMEIFSSSFDKLYYIMMNEINHIANLHHYKNYSAERLLNMSYLVDGKFKFRY